MPFVFDDRGPRHKAQPQGCDEDDLLQRIAALRVAICFDEQRFGFVVMFVGRAKYIRKVRIRKRIVGIGFDICAELFGVAQFVFQLLIFVGGKLCVAVVRQIGLEGRIGHGFGRGPQHQLTQAGGVLA
jgi:hypothetical protein